GFRPLHKRPRKLSIKTQRPRLDQPIVKEYPLRKRILLKRRPRPIPHATHGITSYSRRRVQMKSSGSRLQRERRWRCFALLKAVSPKAHYYCFMRPKCLLDGLHHWKTYAATCRNMAGKHSPLPCRSPKELLFLPASYRL